MAAAPPSSIGGDNVGGCKADGTIDLLIRLGSLDFSTELEGVFAPRPGQRIRIDHARIMAAPVRAEVASAAAIGMAAARDSKYASQTDHDRIVRIPARYLARIIEAVQGVLQLLVAAVQVVMQCGDTTKDCEREIPKRNSLSSVGFKVEVRLSDTLVGSRVMIAAVAVGGPHRLSVFTVVLFIAVGAAETMRAVEVVIDTNGELFTVRGFAKSVDIVDALVRANPAVAARVQPVANIIVVDRRHQIQESLDVSRCIRCARGIPQVAVVDPVRCRIVVRIDCDRFAIVVIRGDFLQQRTKYAGGT